MTRWMRRMAWLTGLLVLLGSSLGCGRDQAKPEAPETPKKRGAPKARQAPAGQTGPAAKSLSGRRIRGEASPSGEAETRSGDPEKAVSGRRPPSGKARGMPRSGS